MSMEKIQVKGRVLEIGSGNNPNPRSDVLCDRYIHDNGQRAGEFGMVIDRPCIVGDGYNLPFADNSFDFVICSHILEHMEDPQAFLQEIARVGKAGYIEVPSMLSERMFGWDFHLWHIRLIGKTIEMYPKKHGPMFGGYFHTMIAKHIWFRRFFETYESHFYVKLYWDKHIERKVFSKSITQLELQKVDALVLEFLNKAKADLVRDVIFYVRWVTRRAIQKSLKVSKNTLWQLLSFVQKANVFRSMQSSLRCVTCHRGSIMINSVSLICSSCNTTYSFDKNIPIILTKEALVHKY